MTALVSVVKLNSNGAPLQVYSQERLFDPRIPRVPDNWNGASPVETEDPYFAELPVTANKRFLIECADEATLRIMNWSKTHEARLRARNRADGVVTNINVLQASTADSPHPEHVTVGGERDLIIETRPQ